MILVPSPHISSTTFTAKDSIKTQNSELKILKSREQVLKNNYKNAIELEASRL